MGKQVYESLVKVDGFHWKIRVWRTETKLGEYNNSDIVTWAQNYLNALHNFPSHKEVLEGILRFPRVAAAEVTDKYDVGCLVYNDWP